MSVSPEPVGLERPYTISGADAGIRVSEQGRALRLRQHREMNANADVYAPVAGRLSARSVAGEYLTYPDSIVVAEPLELDPTA